MTAPRHLHNIALIGFMGTGKSSVAGLLAGLLRFEKIDTDELIEELAGMRIAQIFENSGEERFRAHEREVAESLREERNAVIATGGGFAVGTGNLTSLKSHALVVCLWASPETIWARVRNQTHRPLLRGPDPLGRIRELLAEREPVYREADLLINTEMRSAKDVAQLVARNFKEVTAAGVHL